MEKMTDKSTDTQSRFLNFLDEVQFCGVKEDTRSTLQCMKFCWIIVMFTGICATGYYLFNMVHEYVDVPTATKIQFSDRATYRYPNLLLCPGNWVDYDRIANFNISRDAVDFGLSHILLFSSDTYAKNVNESGEKEFLHYIRSNNIDDYRDFYELIAKSGDGFCRSSDYFADPYAFNSTKLFAGSQVCYLLQFGILDCAKQGLNNPNLVDILYPNKKSDRDEIDHEQDYYRLYVDPDLKFIRGTTSNKVLLESGINYVLSINPTSFIALNSKRKPCISDENYSQTSCFADCMQQNYAAIYERCVVANLVARSANTNYNISYCNPLNRKNPLSRSNKTAFLENSIRCNEQCAPSCARNLPEILLSQAKKKQMAPKATLEMLFDVCGKGVMEVVEYERYSLESLLADIGGVLGLWISASAVTFVQVLMCLLEIGVLKMTNRRKTMTYPLKLEKS